MYKLLQAQNNCNILYTTNMVCFGYIIVNTLYKVNNNNNDLQNEWPSHMQA